MNIHNDGIYKCGDVVMNETKLPKTTFNPLMTKEIEQNLMISSCNHLLKQNLISNEVFQLLKTKILKS